jgi:hypothetical protein
MIHNVIPCEDARKFWLPIWNFDFDFFLFGFDFQQRADTENCQWDGGKHILKHPK